VRLGELVPIRLIGILLLLTASACDRWHASAYPNKDDLTKSVDLGEYASLAGC
jgi:hypothetical protein